MLIPITFLLRAFFGYFGAKTFRKQVKLKAKIRIFERYEKQVYFSLRNVLRPYESRS